MAEEIKYLTPLEQEEAKAKEERYYMKKCIEEEKSRSSNYFFGFWGAFSGALFGAIAYGCIRSAGWIAAIMGLFVVFMASKAYDATKVKRNMYKLYCVVIACIIAIPVGEFLGSIIYVMGDEETVMHTSKYVTYYINNFGLFMKYNFGNLILGYVFTAIGGYGVFKKIKDNTDKLKTMEEELKAEEES